MVVTTIKMPIKIKKVYKDIVEHQKKVFWKKKSDSFPDFIPLVINPVEFGIVSNPTQDMEQRAKDILSKPKNLLYNLS